MMAFFHPDKAELSKQKLQNKPLPSTHEFWQELQDFKEILEFSKENAEKLLVALQKRVATVPARWTSTWNFDVPSRKKGHRPRSNRSLPLTTPLEPSLHQSLPRNEHARNCLIGKTNARALAMPQRVWRISDA